MTEAGSAGGIGRWGPVQCRDRRCAGCAGWRAGGQGGGGRGRRQGGGLVLVLGVCGCGGWGGGQRGAVEEAQQFDRERHDQGAVLLGGDLDDGLQQPELQRGRVGGHDRGGLGQLLGGLVL